MDPGDSMHQFWLFPDWPVACTVVMAFIEFCVLYEIWKSFRYPLYKSIYTPSQRSWGGVYWFHFVHLSVCPSICRPNHVYSVSSTILDLTSSHNSHPAAYLWDQDTGCILWVKSTFVIMEMQYCLHWAQILAQTWLLFQWLCAKLQYHHF